MENALKNQGLIQFYNIEKIGFSFLQFLVQLKNSSQMEKPYSTVHFPSVFRAPLVSQHIRKNFGSAITRTETTMDEIRFPYYMREASSTSSAKYKNKVRQNQKNNPGFAHLSAAS
ncbi:hypothetical protein Droror1_Dr00024450 [Drosera rotundifolia]